jgi:electron transfer flavoprotein alpha subunit
MGDVLVYAGGPGRIDPRRLLAWARPYVDALGGALIALVVTAGPATTAGSEAADVVLEMAHPALAPYLPEAHELALVEAVKSSKPDLVLLENSTAGIDLGAAVAARAGLPFVSYCVDLSVVNGEAVSVSEIYGGQLLATARTPMPVVVAVNSAALPEQPPERGRGERRSLPPPPGLEQLRTTFVEATEPPADAVDLTRAERIVCVGRGIAGAQNVEVAAQLAAALGAELAASRPVVDAGWVPKVRQIGKSGVRVKPKLYLGLGVSGAPEHVEGMRNAELIVAVNQDPDAAIFNLAHYGVVADLFDIAEELEKLL